MYQLHKMYGQSCRCPGSGRRQIQKQVEQLLGHLAHSLLAFVVPQLHSDLLKPIDSCEQQSVGS